MAKLCGGPTRPGFYQRLVAASIGHGVPTRDYPDRAFFVFICLQILPIGRISPRAAAPLPRGGGRIPFPRRGRRNAGRNMNNGPVILARTPIQVHLMSDEEIQRDPVLRIAFSRGQMSANRFSPPVLPPGFVFVGPMEVQYELYPTAPPLPSPPRPGMPPQYEVAEYENELAMAQVNPEPQVS